MTYANDETKRDRVIDALVDLMKSITQANGYFFDVARVHLMSAWRLTFGTTYPAVGVVISSEERVEALACAADRYEMVVEIIGVNGIAGVQTNWVNQMHRLLGDIQQALSSDRQLGGLADYVEVQSTEMSEIETESESILPACNVTCSVLYRVAVSDVTQ